MKKLFNILFVLICPLVLLAQDFDIQNYSEDDIVGTARYVSMAGSFNALGGDVSAAMDNPAALGVFRHGEISLTMDFSIDNVSSDDLYAKNTYRFTVPQFAWVCHFDRSYRQSGLLHSSILLQYHRVKSFRRVGDFNGYSNLSITDLMADLTNAEGGLTEADLQDNWWDENSIGTLSKAGYEAYLINPSPTNTAGWTSLLYQNESVKNNLYIEQHGSVDVYNFSWGGNINNVVYFGLGANLRSLSYERKATLTEARDRGAKDFYSVESTISTNGFGFDASFGMIVVPTDFFRIGVSYRTPQWMTTTTRSYSDVTNYNPPAEGSSRALYSYSYSYDQSLSLPMQLSAGMAFMFGQKGTISMEYDWQHHDKNLTYDMHKLKVGVELVMKNNFFLRAGYACVSPFSKTEYHFSPAYDDLRTDTDYKNFHRAHYFSAGFGFRNNHVIADLAYQCRLEKSTQYALSRPIYDDYGEFYDWQDVKYDMSATTHRIVFSIAWTSRRK